MFSFNVPQKPNKSCYDSKTETTGQLKTKPRRGMQRRPLKCAAPFVTQCVGAKTSNHALTKNCPYLKGTPALPPLDWEKPQHYNWWCDVQRMWFVSNGIIECHIENKKLKLEIERQIVCVTMFGWMFQPLTNVCSPPNREDSCWSLFVRLHKFLFGEIRLSSFSKRVTSYFSTKPGSIETNPTLVVEVSNVKLISI